MPMIAHVKDHTRPVVERLNGYPHSASWLAGVSVTLLLSEAEARLLRANRQRLEGAFPTAIYPKLRLEQRAGTLWVECKPADGTGFFAHPLNAPHERAQTVLSIVTELLAQLSETNRE